MSVVELPVLRAMDCVAVTLERAELSGSAVWVVSTRRHPGHPPERRWYHIESQALAYAAEQADRHGLLLIDLRSEGATE